MLLLKKQQENRKKLSKSKSKISSSVTETDWNEIFESIEMDFVPIEYVSRITIKFNDGTTWDVDVDNSRKKQPIEQIEDSLEELFDAYDEHISTVDFKLNTDRVKADLSKRVLRFLKLNR